MPRLEDQFEPFLQYCLLQRRLAKSSVANYRIDLRFFHSFLNSLSPPVRDCDEVDRKVLELYLEHLSRQYKVKTIKRKMSCVQSLFTYLERQELVEDTPFRRFRVHLQEGKAAPKSLTAPEMERFLQAVHQDPAAVAGKALLRKLAKDETTVVKRMNRAFFWCRDAAILELLFAVGIRVAELCALRFEDLDTDAGVFHINGKGNRERTLHVADQEVQQVLADYLMVRRSVPVGHSYLFLSRFQEPLSTQGVRNLVDKYAKAAGIRKRVTPHVFRHSFATLLLESGVDIKYVQDFLGHSSISTTQIYLHLSEKSKRQVLAAHHPRSRMEVAPILPQDIS